jgi:hypothetical protein
MIIYQYYFFNIRYKNMRYLSMKTKILTVCAVVMSLSFSASANMNMTPGQVQGKMQANPQAQAKMQQAQMKMQANPQAQAKMQQAEMHKNDMMMKAQQAKQNRQ